jgi:hypothetical protein
MPTITDKKTQPTNQPTRRSVFSEDTKTAYNIDHDRTPLRGNLNYKKDTPSKQDNTKQSNEKQDCDWCVIS